MEQKLKRVREICASIADDEKLLAAKRKRLRRAIFAAWRAGATQQDIADAAGISRQRVSKIIGEDGE